MVVCTRKDSIGGRYVRSREIKAAVCVIRNMGGCIWKNGVVVSVRVVPKYKLLPGRH